jgi:hypothetical protein
MSVEQSCTVNGSIVVSVSVAVYDLIATFQLPMTTPSKIFHQGKGANVDLRERGYNLYKCVGKRN